MIIRRIVLVWLVLATLGSLVTYFVYSDDNDKWFVVIKTMALSVVALPVLFLMTVLYYRFFKINKAAFNEFARSEDNQQP